MAMYHLYRMMTLSLVLVSSCSAVFYLLTWTLPSENLCVQIWQLVDRAIAGVWSSSSNCPKDMPTTFKFCRLDTVDPGLDKDGAATSIAGGPGSAAVPLVTFVIPTKQRATLGRTLLSIRRQSDPGWRAIVVCDGCSESTVASLVSGEDAADHRMRAIGLLRKAGRGRNSAGLVRNAGMAEVATPWVGFVDDDDTVSPDYVRDLRSAVHRYPRVKAVVFRMVKPDGFIVPPVSHEMFSLNCVGISFALDMGMVRTSGLWFIADPAEDYKLLHRVHSITPGVQMLLSSHVDYYVRTDPVTGGAMVRRWGPAINESLIVGCGDH